MDGQPTSIVNVSNKNITGQNISNVGNTYNILSGPDHDLLQALRECVVPEAMYDSKEVVDQGTCHPGTRIAVLEDISAWIERLVSGCALKWMRGAAGAGKSAIAQIFENQLASQGLLLGSFFCLRSNDRRSNGFLVIPTLVEQIITRIPSLAPAVQAAFRADTRILSKSMEIQAMRLVVEPLASIEADLRRSLPRVIVIDGLDEIKGAQAQRDILKTVAFFIDNLSFPIHFFIASRPEHQIQDYFTQSMGGKWSVISLDDAYHPDRDIIIFYKAHFPLIVAAFPAFNFEPDWPGDVARRVPVTKGSGQFIFADIVIRFLGNTSISISPQRRLDMILENVANDKLKPLELLDLVYVTVFEAVPKEELEDVLQLVGLVLLPNRFKKSPRVLDAVLGLEPGTTLNRLRYLHSILKVPSSPNKAIAPLHATLGDFIFNRDRSHSFGLHIDQEQLHQAVILKIMQESMFQPASEQLSDCSGDWFNDLYDDPISKTFIHNPTFQTKLASRIKELQGSDIILWSTFALMETYPAALKGLTPRSSWFGVKDTPSSQSLEKKRKKEMLRRLQSYATMGITGQMLFFIQQLGRCCSAFHGSDAVDAFLEALPDQSALVNQNHAGLALPSDNPYLDHPDTEKVCSVFAKHFVNPTFVETLFTLFPWNNRNRPEPFDLYLAFSKRVFFYTGREEAYLLRILSLRNLPQDNPRWSDAVKVAFNAFLDTVLDQVAGKKARTHSGPKFEAAKEALERVTTWERYREV